MFVTFKTELRKKRIDNEGGNMLYDIIKKYDII